MDGDVARIDAFCLHHRLFVAEVIMGVVDHAVVDSLQRRLRILPGREQRAVQLVEGIDQFMMLRIDLIETGDERRIPDEGIRNLAGREIARRVVCAGLSHSVSVRSHSARDQCSPLWRARPSSRSFSRCAVSERFATGRITASTSS